MENKMKSFYQQENPLTPVALLAGIAIGAAIGVLYAPKSGSQVRTKIIDTSKALLSLIGLGTTTVRQKTGSITGNVLKDKRVKSQEVADQLTGAAGSRKNPTEIKVPSAGTMAWKKQKSKDPELYNQYKTYQ